MGFLIIEELNINLLICLDGIVLNGKNPFQFLKMGDNMG